MITQDYLKSILQYDPLTGSFTRLVSRSNNARVGEIAGCLKDDGYIYIGINYKRYLAHRLAWLYMKGSLPKEEIDHINCKKDDNRWINLREATHRQNCFNRKLQENNMLKTKGVRVHQGKYQARISLDGKQKIIGSFYTKEEAGYAYQQFAKANHGEFFHSKRGA